MSTKTMLYNHLKSKGCFTTDLPGIIQQGVNTIATNASYRMKLMMAATELMVFTSQLRKPILLEGHILAEDEEDDDLAEFTPKDTLVTISAITFILARSGLAKDSSMNAIRGALKPAYNLIEAARVENHKELAKEDAVRNGATSDDWIKYYSKPRDLFGGIGTLEGQMKHLAALERGELGAGYIQVSELGSELQSNKDIAPNIVALAIGYDIGQIPAKTVKSDENQTEAIHGLPYSALMFGSQDIILYDERVKSIFKEEFSTKLSRRSWLLLNTEVPVNISYSDPYELVKHKRRVQRDAQRAKKLLAKPMADLVTSTTREPLVLTDEADAMFIQYQEYCDLESQDMSKLHPISTLARKHMHWKTLKMAGSFAILRGKKEITERDYRQAINFSEMFANDLAIFETELAKEPYELFADFMQDRATEGKAEISVHELRKLEYIKGTGSVENKMKELVKLTASYDTDAIYTIEDTKILYEKIIRTNVIGASFVLNDHSELRKAIENGADKDQIQYLKQKISYSAVYGYEYVEVGFPDLGNLLTADCAFNSFRLKNALTDAVYDKEKHPQAFGGVRGSENVYGPCKWLCLDVDTSTITDEEAHYMLGSINHHIARTSNPNNPFKFRVIIELDAEVDLPSKLWRYFLKSVGEYLSIEVDLLPKSQITYGYAGRSVMSVVNKDPLEVRDHIMFAHSEDAEKPSFDASKYTKTQRVAMLAAPMSTFDQAFEAMHGEGGRKLIWAAHKAKSLGATTEETITIIREINDYWDDSMPDKTLQSTVLSQIARF